MRRTTMVLALCALALLVAACVQDGDQQPHSDGMEELTAATGPGGWIEANLAFEFEEAEVLNHSQAEESLADYLRVVLDLRTAGGHDLKAIGLIWHAENDHLESDVSAVGPLRIRGQSYSEGDPRAIRATADLNLRIPGGDTIPARAAMFIFPDGTSFDEADALFFGEARLLPAAGQSHPTADVVPYSAVSNEGAFVGMLLGDGADQKFGELELWFHYLAELWTTPFGTVQLLTGFAGAEGSSRPTVALAVDLKPAQAPASVVMLCEDCLGQARDVAITVLADGFTATDDLWLTLPYLHGAPFWASGRGEPPMRGDPTCKDVLTFGGRAVWAANLYYHHHNSLVAGAQLALLDKDVTLHAPGSAEHDAAILRLYDAEQGAWDTATFFLKHLEELSCF